jgi:hypothetical protein
MTASAAKDPNIRNDIIASTILLANPQSRISCCPLMGASETTML